MASSVQLYPRKPFSEDRINNPFPQLIQTPTGLALLELQGTINLPNTESEGAGKSPDILIGRISFPDYNPDALDPSSTSWMKRVHLYVGQHQRLAGEVKKLPKALAVIRKRATSCEDVTIKDAVPEDKSEDLEVVEIVKYKLVFSQRPEPVSTG